MKNTITKAMDSIPENEGNVNSLDTLKRNYEKAVSSGKDSTNELTALATAVAYSVVNKFADPQRKTAAGRESVSNNGLNPVITSLRSGIGHDLALLDNTRRTAEEATKTHHNADGDIITKTADPKAEAALSKLIGETLSDGLDLVQTATLAILEETAEHATGENWLDTPYTVRRLSKRVYIRAEDSAAYKDMETTPIQEIYRAVNRLVEYTRATQTDPRNGYLYLSELTEDGMETIYRRLGKWADLGGYEQGGHYGQPGRPDTSTGAYTAGAQAVANYESIIAKLNLTDRQATIIKLRMQGRGYKAIAAYLGVNEAGIKIQIRRIRKHCEEIGFTPSMWEEMTSEQNDDDNKK